MSRIADLDIRGSVHRYHRNQGLDEPALSMPPESANKLRYSNLEDKRNPRTGEVETNDSRLFIIPDLLQFGDYNNSTTVERSNVRVFWDRYSDVDGVYRVTGAYGFQAIALRGNVEHEDIAWDLQSLEDYPVLDESDWSQLELDLQQEYVGESGLDEFRREVRKSMEQMAVDYCQDYGLDVDKNVSNVIDELDEIPADVWNELFWDCFRESNAEFIHETPNWPYLDIDTVAAEFPYNVYIKKALR